MKQKRTIITLGLILAILCLGIVYAAIDGIELNINGSASALLGNGVVDVIFTSANAGVGSEDFVTAVAVGSDPTTATFTVEGLQNKGDTATIEFTIENQSEELKALVSVDTKTITNADFFAIDAVVADSSALAPEGTTTVTVTVSLIKTPVDTITGTINVELLAEAVLGN